MSFPILGCPWMTDSGYNNIINTDPYVYTQHFIQITIYKRDVMATVDYIFLHWLCSNIKVAVFYFIMKLVTALVFLILKRDILLRLNGSKSKTLAILTFKLKGILSVQVRRLWDRRWSPPSIRIYFLLFFFVSHLTQVL